MAKALDEKDVSAAVQRLGMTAEAERLAQWVALYGARLGVTEVREADPAAAGVDGWHRAYGELTVHVCSEYGDPSDATHTRIRGALLSPYENQVEDERRAGQKARSRRKAREASGASGPGKT